MRQVKVFAGNSHPSLTAAICERLGSAPAQCELTKFSNGETSVSIGTSIRNHDIYIIQSGSRRINDSIMELLIMISACKGGSARTITAVIPYFPYCRSSKKKSHRGAITARMLANLLSVAGVDHIITVDLHAPPMQGFFGKPVDNLYAEPIIARWIRSNVKRWQDAVVVSKSAGGSKRVTSLADALKLSFAIITTDRRRLPFGSSMIFEQGALLNNLMGLDGINDEHEEDIPNQSREERPPIIPRESITPPTRASPRYGARVNGSNTINSGLASPRYSEGPRASPLQQSTTASSDSPSPRVRPNRSQTAPGPFRPLDDDDAGEEYTDEKAKDVITGRLIQGHIVDDDFPSPMLSTMSGSVAALPTDQIGPSGFDEQRDPMSASFVSVVSSVQHDIAMGGTYDGAVLSDEDEEEKLKNPELEHTVTLVGNVNGKTTIIIDDIMDRSESWIAAAETVVKRGGATKVYCVATHGLFGDNALDELDQCDCIDYIVVCDTFPIDFDSQRSSKKLVVLPLAGLLAEAIRRNQHGESLSQIYQYYQD